MRREEKEDEEEAEGKTIEKEENQRQEQRKAEDKTKTKLRMNEEEQNNRNKKQFRNFLKVFCSLSFSSRMFDAVTIIPYFLLFGLSILMAIGVIIHLTYVTRKPKKKKKEFIPSNFLS